MRLVDLIELWAKEKGWWAFKNTEYEKPYINIKKKRSKAVLGRRWDPVDYITVFDTGEIDTPDRNTVLIPADPNFFTKLEAIIDQHS